MTPNSFRISRGVAALAALALVAACGLPRPGPNRSEIFAGSVLQEGDAFILTVDDRINRIAGVTPALGFTSEMNSAAVVGSDTIQPGDVLALTIWENVDDGLLVPSGQNATVLDEVQVDGAGFIFVPYAGRVRAAGNSPEEVRRIISEKLEEQTPDPQVQVARLAGDGSTVSVVGAVGVQGVYPIERPTRTLSAMLANAGGVAIDPQVAIIRVTRNGQTGKAWRGIDVTAKGRHWAYMPEDLEKMDKAGRIHWPKKADGMPRLKQYSQDLPGVPMQDVIGDIKPMHNLSDERLGYPTQKPLALLERIIAASSNKGDVEIGRASCRERV